MVPFAGKDKQDAIRQEGRINFFPNSPINQIETDLLSAVKFWKPSLINAIHFQKEANYLKSFQFLVFDQLEHFKFDTALENDK